MDEITQENRLMSVFTPLPPNTLLIDSVQASEAISRPFEFNLRLLATVSNNKFANVKPHELIGQPMRVVLRHPAGERHFHGIVKHFSKDRQDREFAYYSAGLVPWFALLDLTENSRIFQSKTVPDIIQAVVAELGFAQMLRSNLTRTYSEWDYCVQYRESDFRFLSRLMEAEGIYYYFEHSASQHTMVLADALSCYKALPVQHSFRYSFESGLDIEEDAVKTWSYAETLESGKRTLRDYHFEMPTNTLEVTEQSEALGQQAQPFEVYDFPGGYAKKFNKPESRLGNVRPEGERLIRQQMEMVEAAYLVYGGTSTCRPFVPGFTISLDGGEASGSYLLTSAIHSINQEPDYRNQPSSELMYQNRFTCIPSSTLFRPLLLTAKPVVKGPLTAVVIDENPTPTEEIWPDKYGRVRVRFPWDREAKYACWIRVCQPWAGRGWGHQWIPRVGDEVVVDFLEGDPDCPIIVGTVYNKDNMPPFELPANKTQSGVKTRSSAKGSAQNFNMLRFEDKKGSEVLELHAERTMIEGVEASQFLTVGGNQHITVGGGKDSDSGNVKESVAKNHNLHVKGDRREKVDGKTSVHGKTTLIHTDEMLYFNSDQTLAGSGTQAVFFQSTASLCLQVGGSFIKLSPAGVDIVGPIVKINSAGSVPATPPLSPLEDPPDEPGNS
jgi:type VI secretion system secreted protein VgrG